jgi:VWFA-related protein
MPPTTLKTSTRMVTLEVVAHDHQGRMVPNLTAKDFQVYEEILPRKNQLPQSIAAFQQVNLPELRAAGKGPAQLPAGVYSNLSTMQSLTVPPTILLIDGINTDLASQMQVHRQMVKMLASIPADVPTAVYLMDRRLHLLQTFTTDPKLLRDAAAKALSLDSGLVQGDSHEDPNAVSAILEIQPYVTEDTLAAIRTFERESFSSMMDIRVQETLDALRSIARYLAGYPGRKNLLWISSSFPLMIAPDGDNKFSGMRAYASQMNDVTNALADAKVAVYPMDAGGLSTSTNFDPSARVRHAGPGGGFGQAVQGENLNRDSTQESMHVLADQTGGRTCVNNNDLADCVRAAVNDGSSYYELAYYPDSSLWHGEFHRIVVKGPSGVRLAYREGYYARTEDSAAAGDAGPSDLDLQKAACQDLLNATALLVMAEKIPADQPGQAKYFLAIDPNAITFAPADAGARNLELSFAVCAFDKDGKAVQYLHETSDQKLTEQQFAAIKAQHGIPHPVAFAPPPPTVRVRLVVQDKFSRRMGSIDVPYVADGTPATPAVPPPSKPVSGGPR